MLVLVPYFANFSLLVLSHDPALLELPVLRNRSAWYCPMLDCIVAITLQIILELTDGSPSLPRFAPYPSLLHFAPLSSRD